MKAVVIGATGHIGNAFVRALIGEGWEVLATSRRDSPTPNLVGLDAQFATGNADDPGQLHDWTKHADLVVDAAAPYHLWLDAAETDSAIQRLDSLIEAVSRNTCKLIHVSSFTTFDQSRGYLRQLQEEVWNRIHPYFALKANLEQRVRMAADEGLPAVIVNPTQCVGPWDIKPQEYCLIPALLRGGVPGTSNHEINVIDVRDVAAVSLRALENGVFGKPILLAGQNTTLDMFMNRICELRGVEPPAFNVPSQLSAWAAYGGEMLSSLIPAAPSYPSLGMVLLLAQRWAFPSRAQREANGIYHRLSRSLVDSIDWYDQIGYLDG